MSRVGRRVARLVTRTAELLDVQPVTGPRPSSSARRAVSWMLAWACAAGLVGSGALVWVGTSAAFTATTPNAANSWTAGSVTIGDDDSGGLLFNVSGLVPGASRSECIKVSYSGNAPSTVKLYVASSSGLLTPYILIAVEEGTGSGNTGAFGSCAGFSGTTIFSSTLSGMADTKVAFSSGVGSFAPTTAGDSMVYKFTYTLRYITPDSLQGETCSATFQWESRA